MLFETGGNIRIDYKLTGKGKTIALVNGFGAYQEIWSTQVSLLSNLGYQVLTYNHWNTGKSKQTEKGHNIAHLAQDLGELISFLKTKQAASMGHPMGTSIIFCLMKKWPTVVKCTLVTGQSSKILNGRNWKCGPMDCISENYHEKYQRRLHVRETFAGLDDNVYAQLMKTKEEDPSNKEDNVDLLENHMSPDRRKVVRNASIPITFFTARESPYYREGYEKPLEEKNNQVDSFIMSPTGHAVMVEIPKQFNSKLEDILG